VSAIVVRGRGGDEVLRITHDAELSASPMLVIDAMRNLAQEVKDIERIIRILRFRIKHLEYRASWTKYPENSIRAQSRADAYRVWLSHLELMQK